MRFLQRCLSRPVPTSLNSLPVSTALTSCVSSGKSVSAPHIDRLTCERTRFTARITASPAYRPSRASLMMGMPPLSHGIRDSGIDPHMSKHGFAALLADACNQTVFVGGAVKSKRQALQG